MFHIFYFIQSDSGGFMLFSVVSIEISQCSCLFGIYEWTDDQQVVC